MSSKGRVRGSVLRHAAGDSSSFRVGSTQLSGRIVVLSPHADDAALSVGALIAESCRRGAHVTVVTVFGGILDSTAPAGDWDSWSGFRTEGEATRARRREDQEACAVLGARCVPLPFCDDQYATRADGETVYRAVAQALSGADVVLAPGFPLTHPDHAWLTATVLERGLQSGRLGLYVELPYAIAALPRGEEPRVSATLGDLVPSNVEFSRVAASVGARLRKWRALRRYPSQIRRFGRLLGGGASSPRRLLLGERRIGGEAVAWLPLRER